MVEEVQAFQVQQVLRRASGVICLFVDGIFLRISTYFDRLID